MHLRFLWYKEQNVLAFMVAEVRQTAEMCRFFTLGGVSKLERHPHGISYISKEIIKKKEKGKKHKGAVSFGEKGK